MRKKAVIEAIPDAYRLIADPEVLEACLEVHARLDLEEQFEAWLAHATAWSGAWGGLALGPGEEPDALGLVASCCNPGRALPGLRSVDRSVVAGWLEGGWSLFEGLGPFGAIAAVEPEPGPEFTCATGFEIAGRTCAAAVILLAEQAPPASTLEKLAHLVEATRPALANALQVRSIRELVIKDDTAQCFNRRYFESSLPDELSRAARFHAPLSLIFLDMDNLKQVNNQHGHAMGSRTLFEVSRRVRVKIRRFDKLFRFGGDEFCIVLPETEWHGALEVAERVRDAIASKPLLTEELGDPAGVPMTASLGIASYPLHARTQKELIEQADRAMQRVKKGTKNAIGIAEILGEDHGS